MPNKKAAIKHLKQSEKRNTRNSLVKRSIKEIIKQGEKSVAKGDIKEKASELTHSLQKTVDKAVKAGIIKENTGNRKKTRFSKMLKQAGADTQAKSAKKAEAKKEEKK